MPCIFVNTELLKISRGLINGTAFMFNRYLMFEIFVPGLILNYVFFVLLVSSSSVRNPFECVGNTVLELVPNASIIKGAV